MHYTAIITQSLPSVRVGESSSENSRQSYSGPRCDQPTFTRSRMCLLSVTSVEWTWTRRFIWSLIWTTTFAVRSISARTARRRSATLLASRSIAQWPTGTKIRSKRNDFNVISVRSATWQSFSSVNTSFRTWIWKAKSAAYVLLPLTRLTTSRIISSESTTHRRCLSARRKIAKKLSSVAAIWRTTATRSTRLSRFMSNARHVKLSCSRRDCKATWSTDIRRRPLTSHSCALFAEKLSATRKICNDITRLSTSQQIAASPILAMSAIWSSIGDGNSQRTRLTISMDLFIIVKNVATNTKRRRISPIT